MNVFCALLSKQLTLEERLLERRAMAVRHGLPFHRKVVKQQVWVGETGRTAIVAWSNDQAASTLIVETAMGARTAAGWVVSPDVHDPWDVQEIGDRLVFTPREASTLGGGFVLLEAIDALPLLLAMNSLTRVEPLYWVETEREILVSNRALIVHLLAAGSPTPVLNRQTLPSFLVSGFFTFDRTAFKGVQVVPRNSCLTATDTGVNIAPIDDFDRRVGRSLRTKDSAQEMASLLVETASKLAQGRQVRVGLSGGKDSRTVAAAFRKANANLYAVTSGLTGNPDVEAARLVATALNLPHHVERPLEGDEAGNLQVDLLARVRRNLRQTDGLIFGWENLPDSHVLIDRVGTGGQGAAPLKSLTGNRPLKQGEVSPGEVRRTVRGRLERFSSLLAPEWIASEEQAAEGWIAERARHDPRVQLDLYQIEVINARWFGPLNGGFTDERSAPLFYDNQVARLGSMLKPQEREDERFIFDVMTCLAPELATVPLERKRWIFEQSGPSQGDEAGWLARTPIEAEPGTEGAFNWRNAWTADLFEPFFEQLFRNHEVDALFAYLNREAAEQWFLSRREQSPGITESNVAWSMFSASVLIENRWLETHPAEVSSIRIPKADR